MSNEGFKKMVKMKIERLKKKRTKTKDKSPYLPGVSYGEKETLTSTRED